MRIPFLNGMSGEPLPYLLHTDWMVTTLLLICILLTTIAFAKEKKYLLNRLKSSIASRERASMFDEATTTDVRYTFLLVLHSCILLGLCIYHYYTQAMPALLEKTVHIYLLGGAILLVFFLFIIKCALYGFINWTFFQKVKNSAWMTSFFNLFIWLGILLLPVILVIIYFDISSQISLYLIGFLIIFAKISLFWKCFSNFFEKIHGAFHLILYFCALEILPDLIFWKGIELLNNNLILNL